MKSGRSGTILLVVNMITAALLVLAVILFKIVYNNLATVDNLLQREKAFWLAEAGLVMGRVEIRRNPGWYAEKEENFGGGRVRIIRKFGEEQFWAIGGFGKGQVVLIENGGTK